jgi:hypothetical protein
MSTPQRRLAAPLVSCGQLQSPREGLDPRPSSERWAPRLMAGHAGRLWRVH